MSIHDVARLGQAMQTDITAIHCLSPRTIKILEDAGFRTVADLRDAVIEDDKIPGVAKERRLEIERALMALGALPGPFDEHEPKRKSHLFVALQSHAIGLEDGKAAAERAAMNQMLSFAAVNDFTVGTMKDRVLVAYAKGNALMGFRISVTHHVPGIGPMNAQCGLTVSVDGMNEMLRRWNPTMREVVKGDVIMQFDGAPSRVGEISMLFEPCEGIVRLKPACDRPVRHAAYERAFGRC
jgi:hypothetical protein